MSQNQLIHQMYKKSIVSLDDDFTVTPLQIAESGIIAKCCLSQKVEVEEEQNEDGDRYSFEESFHQNQENPSRSKFKFAPDALKDAAL